jgi:hypothetical protein
MVNSSSRPRSIAKLLLTRLRDFSSEPGDHSEKWRMAP